MHRMLIVVLGAGLMLGGVAAYPAYADDPPKKTKKKPAKPAKKKAETKKADKRS